MKHKKQKPIKCPYCGCTAILKKGSDIYGEHATIQYLYVCSKYPVCDSYVGVHTGTKKPKGTLANAELRNKRIKTHRVFDSIWKHGIMSRENAYRWIQDIFSFSREQAHIGQFSNYQCDYLIKMCQNVLKNNKIA